MAAVLERKGKTVLKQSLTSADVPLRGPLCTFWWSICFSAFCNAKCCNSFGLAVPVSVRAEPEGLLLGSLQSFFKYQNSPFNPNYCFVSFSFYIAESTVFEAITSFIVTSLQVNKSIFTFCTSLSNERHKVMLIYFSQNVSPKSSATDN